MTIDTTSSDQTKRMGNEQNDVNVSKFQTPSNKRQFKAQQK